VLLDPESAAELDQQSGRLTSGANPTRRNSDKFRNAYGDFAGQEECVAHRGADSGGASRFFPVFNHREGEASAEQRYTDSGGTNFAMQPGERRPPGTPPDYFPVFKYSAKAPGAERPSADGVSHPTVKPLELMRWLVRLITPPGGVVLDPFAGTGTTAEAAIHEHKRAIVIEREPDYLPLIVARLSKPMAVGFDFGEGA
jgi:site-specific DNA-methyltransferase (adenine-specific)